MHFHCGVEGFNLNDGMKRSNELIVVPLLLQLLLWSDAASVAALFLSAVHRSWMKSCIAFTANHLVTIVLLSKYT